ncbi:MAG: alpha-2-macroglobulin family protein, partial [Chthoniobacteraceae bacterium]|nr:alpha-2-macroglobulin family protein [Chthoniobacteraceae bacterium]
TGADDALGIPEGEPVEWSIVRSRTDGEEDSREAIASGTTKVDAYGGFEGEWAMPKTIGPRHYQLNAKLPRKDGETGVEINVQEFRPPPFAVKLTESKQGQDTAGVRIQSVYFHGAPNAGAMVKWEAVWTRLYSDKATEGEFVNGSYFVETDPCHLFRIQEVEKKVAGEGKLGADGTLVLKSKPPFTDAVPRGWYNVQWTVSVLGSEGQTITEPAVFPLYTVPVALGVEAREKPGTGKIVTIKANAYQPNDEPAAGTPLRADLFHVINKSVKEQISSHVYRYRNTTLYEKVKTVTGAAPLEESAAVTEPGNYLVAVHHAENDAVPTEYCQFGVSGDKEDRPAEFAQTNDEKFEVKADKKVYTPGETAALSLQAPFAGTAWVSVEADGRVLDAFECRLESNAGRVGIPIKKAYFPNAWVSIYLMRPAGEDRLPAERMGSVQLNVSRPDLDLHIAPALSGTQARPGELISGTVEALCEGKPVADTDITVYAVDEALLVAGGWEEPKFLETMYPRRNWAVQSFFSKLNELGRKFDDDAFSQKGFILGDGGEGGALGPKKAARKAFLPLAFWKTGLRTGPDGKASFEFKAPDSLTRYRVIALAQTKAHQFGFGTNAVEISKPVQIEPALPRFLRVGDSVELRAIVRQTVADKLPVALHCEGSLKLQGASTQTQSVRRNDPSVFRFPATAGESDSATVRWDTDAGPGDAVEMSLPVYPPTLLRKEAVFGALGTSDPLADLHRLVPDAWNQAVGKADVTLSTSPWLPKLTGLPLLLQYPHGCFEQITSRILGYTALGRLLAYLPDGGLHDHEYRLRVEEGLQKMNAALLKGGWLPYWPGGKQPSPYPTIAGYWAARSAKANGWEVPPRLLSMLPKTVRSIADGKEEDLSGDSFMRCFAVMVLSEEKADKLESAVRDLYERREGYNEESRAFLAIAMHRLGIMPKEKEQLLKEIDRSLKTAGFNPDTFGSTTRTEAIRAWAFAVIHPEANEGKARKELGKRIDDLLDSARSLSTQENFWLLLAFQSMHADEPAPAVDFSAFRPAPTALSPNKASALWAERDIRSLRQLSIVNQAGKASPLAGTACLLDAQFRMTSADAERDNRTDRGFRVERVVRNMTDPARTGEAASPWKLGDQILITIRLLSPKEQHYVAVEGELPACLETLNPNLPSVARSYTFPLAQGDKPLSLSFAELRDKTTCLYFNHVEPGIAVYSVVARVTSAGSFRWPATQAVPMYDSRFSGVSAAAEVHSAGE